MTLITKPRITLLPEPEVTGGQALERTLFLRRSIRDYSAAPLTLGQCAQLLWSCQGITSKEGFRTAPSAGAVFPLEIYAAVEHVRGLDPGVYHYTPGPGLLEHRLELVREGSLQENLFELSTRQDFIKTVPLNIILTSVTSRMIEKYGEGSALRYVLLEMGHAAQNLHLQAEALGLGSVAVGYMDEPRLKELLGAAVDPLYFVSIGHKLNPEDKS